MDLAEPNLISTEYRPDKLLDIFQCPSRVGSPVVLFWHGSGPNERDALSTLASAVNKQGAVCLVPDWQSDTNAEGRKNLLDSITFARKEAETYGGDPTRISLCGWSLGANAAADLTLHPDVIEGWRPNAFVGIAGGYDKSPITDGALTDHMTSEPDVPCLLVHGTEDHVVDVQRSRDSHEALLGWGWKSTLREVGTDHAGIIGTRYDPQKNRCLPTNELERVEAVNAVANWIYAHVTSGA
jgi:predicted esterase